MKKQRALYKSKQYEEWANKNEQKAQEIHDQFFGQYGSFLSLGEPIKVGHHSEKKHRKIIDRMDNTMRKVIDLKEKAKEQRNKSDNLYAFSQRNKGDAERKRQEKRDKADKLYKVGSVVYSPFLRECVIKKVNKKTFTIQKVDSNYTCTEDKSFFVN